MAVHAVQLPAGPTVYCWFARLRDDGTWQTINHAPVMQDRERVERFLAWINRNRRLAKDLDAASAILLRRLAR